MRLGGHGAQPAYSITRYLGMSADGRMGVVTQLSSVSLNRHPEFASLMGRSPCILVVKV